MGWYHEPRVPQGEPAVNEKDVWLEDGVIKLGHWDGSAWVVEATVDSTGLLGEKGATGDEGPPCPTGGTLIHWTVNTHRSSQQPATVIRAITPKYITTSGNRASPIL